MALSDIVNIAISVASANAIQPGYGKALILQYHTHYADRIRTYVNASDLLTDGFGATEPAYLAAQALCSQNPRPPDFQVGRLALAPTMHWTLTPGVHDSTVYTVSVDGQSASFTSGVGATASTICSGLKTAIDALSLAVTAVAGTTLTLAANVAGVYHYFEAADPALESIVMDHADPGVATDLAAIATADNTWYALINPYPSVAMSAAVSTYAEANTKIYLVASQNGDILTGSTTDIASAAQTNGDTRTAVLYHPQPHQFADAAWAGARLWTNPGSETWAFVALAGVSATTPQLTATQRTNALAKNATVYETVAGLNITEFGHVGANTGGSWIDIIRFRDWLQSTMQINILVALTSNLKIPYTDSGIGIIEAQVRATLEAGISAGGLARNPAYQVSVPKASSVSSSDRTARVLNNVTFTAQLAGAIHTVNIKGQVTV